MSRLLEVTEAEFFIREAVAKDASEVCKIMIAAIKTCVADHNNSSEIIEEWCANKTEENVIQWISNPDNITLGSVLN